MIDTTVPNLSIKSSSVWSAEGKAASKQTKRGMFDNGIKRDITRRLVSADMQRQRDEIKRNRIARNHRKFDKGTPV